MQDRMDQLYVTDRLDRLAMAMPRMNRPPIPNTDAFGSDVHLFNECTRMWHLVGGWVRWTEMGKDTLPKRKPD
jgi:hypothetical protein